MNLPVPTPSARLVTRLADPALAESLSHFVRARVPESEVEDIVQATITEALAAEEAPEDDEEIVRWVHGICRHKVIDWFRRTRRELPHDPELADETVAAAESVPQSALDLLRWAQKELPEGEEHKKTLEWMLREGEGEKLETIAAEAKVPAPRVRQRVSRLRRYYKAKWAAQAAALAALLVIAVALVLALRKKREEIAPLPSPSFVPAPPPVPQLPPERPALSTEPSAQPLPSAPSAPSAAPPSASSSAMPRSMSTTPVPTFSGAPKGPTKALPRPKAGYSSL
jgi:DNA-directed RNA polymerase specialized sigma24 family protein